MRWSLLLLAACGSPDEGKVTPTGTTPPGTTPTTTTTTEPQPTTGTTPLVGDPWVLALDPPGSVNNGRFATSDVCGRCHSNASSADAMRDAADRPVGMVDLWQASMMANAGRDPLWRAAMSAEVATTPAAQAAIEAKCTRCHAPMGWTDAALVGDPPVDASILTDGTERMELALDGVSCTACHQIEAAGLGTDASFSGGYTIAGTSTIYGPHQNPNGMPMQAETGFSPVYAGHVTRAELCATCHQQQVHTLAADGTETGTVVPEQAVYAEWENSWAFAAGVSCQDCHLPLVDEDGLPIRTQIARQPSGGDFPGMMASDREPYGRHVLVGGNTLIPGILRDWSEVLQPRASAAAFDSKIAAARENLATAATVRVLDAAVAGDVLSFVVDVLPTTGHRFPTGIPVRRAWLHVTVEDAAGAVVLESGAWDAEGRIVDGAGAVLASEVAGGPVPPHLDALTSSDEAQVYEAVLRDEAGAPVWRLTRGAGFYKDNRLLPDGWDPSHPQLGWTSTAGAEADPDYADGGDQVRVEVALAGAPGPLTVHAELVYQPLSHRWAEELFAVGTPEALGFQVMWAAADRTPELAGQATLVVP